MLSLTILFITHVYPCWFSIKIKGTNFISKYAQVQKTTTSEHENTKTFPYFPFWPGWIFKFFFSHFRKSEFGGFEKQEIKLFWPFKDLVKVSCAPPQYRVTNYGAHPPPPNLKVALRSLCIYTQNYRVAVYLANNYLRGYNTTKNVYDKNIIHLNN